MKIIGIWTIVILAVSFIGTQAEQVDFKIPFTSIYLEEETLPVISEMNVYIPINEIDLESVITVVEFEEMIDEVEESSSSETIIISFDELHNKINANEVQIGTIYQFEAELHYAGNRDITRNYQLQLIAPNSESNQFGGRNTINITVSQDNQSLLRIGSVHTFNAKAFQWQSPNSNTSFPMFQGIGLNGGIMLSGTDFGNELGNLRDSESERAAAREEILFNQLNDDLPNLINLINQLTGEIIINNIENNKNLEMVISLNDIFKELGDENIKLNISKINETLLEFTMNYIQTVPEIIYKIEGIEVARNASMSEPQRLIFSNYTQEEEQEIDWVNVTAFINELAGQTIIDNITIGNRNSAININLNKVLNDFSSRSIKRENIEVINRMIVEYFEEFETRNANITFFIQGNQVASNREILNPREVRHN